MVSSRIRASYKSLRTKSRDPGPKTLPGKRSPKLSTSSIRQLHGSSLYPQTREHTFSGTLLLGVETANMMQQTGITIRARMSWAR